ncbi:MAG: hypothetical protein HY814_08035 [Candidatus Riflebacteria bacterium]|nr:hypothetical protein [Candidatus Riflebacteria bacterium]
MREVLVRLLLVSCLAAIAGCENPDYRNVLFRPQSQDPEAYKNALRLHVVTTEHRQQPWGNDLLLRQDLVFGRDLAPIASLAVRLDGLEHRTDRKGFLGLERLQPGFHDLEVSAGGRTHHLAIPIEKGKMTLCVLQAERAARFAASRVVLPHSFLLTGPFRELAQLHRKLGRLLDALEGRPSEAAFAAAIDGSYTDRSGGRDDLLAARAFRRDSGTLPVLVVRAAVADFAANPPVAVLSAETDGHRTLSRLTLVPGPEPDSPLLLASAAGASPFVFTATPAPVSARKSSR